jgi:hypothetical protein
MTIESMSLKSSTEMIEYCGEEARRSRAAKALYSYLRASDTAMGGEKAAQHGHHREESIRNCRYELSRKENEGRGARLASGVLMGQRSRKAVQPRGTWFGAASACPREEIF